MLVNQPNLQINSKPVESQYKSNQAAQKLFSSLKARNIRSCIIPKEKYLRIRKGDLPFPHGCKQYNQDLFRILSQPEVLIWAYAKIKTNKTVTSREVKTKSLHESEIDRVKTHSVRPHSAPKQSRSNPTGLVRDWSRATLFRARREDEISVNTVHKICAELKTGKYQFKIVKNTFSAKADKEKSLAESAPNANDKIVQTACAKILESIYEAEFQLMQFNYGGRINCSAANAIAKIKLQGRGCTWFLKGGIKGGFDEINPEILMQILSRKIKDHKFLKIIKKMLKAGIMQELRETHDLTGIPQGETISTILFNIYMYEFDIYVNNNLRFFVRRVRRKIDDAIKNGNINQLISNTRYLKRIPTYLKEATEFKNLQESSRYSRKLIKNCIGKSKFEELTCKEQDKIRSATRKIRENKRRSLILPSRSHQQFRLRLHYVRYAEDWVIFFRGPESLGLYFKNKISVWLKQELKLKLSIEKTELINIREKAVDFLAFRFIMMGKKIEKSEVTYLRKQKTDKSKSPGIKRVTEHNIRIGIPIEKIISKLYSYNCCDCDGYPREKRSISFKSDSDIILYYRKLWLAFFYYYTRFTPKSAVARIHYILYYSCVKTLAQKHHTTLPQILKKYGSEPTAWKKSSFQKQTRPITFPNFANTKKNC